MATGLIAMTCFVRISVHNRHHTLVSKPTIPRHGNSSHHYIHKSPSIRNLSIISTKISLKKNFSLARIKAFSVYVFHLLFDTVTLLSVLVASACLVTSSRFVPLAQTGCLRISPYKIRHKNQRPHRKKFLAIVNRTSMHG